MVAGELHENVADRRLDAPPLSDVEVGVGRDEFDAAQPPLSIEGKAHSPYPLRGGGAKVEDGWRKFLGDKDYQQMHDALLALPEITDPYR